MSSSCLLMVQPHSAPVCLQARDDLLVRVGSVYARDWRVKGEFGGLVQGCNISSALAMEILLPCPKPSNYSTTSRYHKHAFPQWHAFLWAVCVALCHVSSVGFYKENRNPCLFPLPARSVTFPWLPRGWVMIGWKHNETRGKITSTALLELMDLIGTGCLGGNTTETTRHKRKLKSGEELQTSLLGTENDLSGIMQPCFDYYRILICPGICFSINGSPCRCELSRVSLE